MAYLTQPQTGELPTGFFQSDTYGQYGANYGWGIGTCILKRPHPGLAADALARHLRSRRRLGTQAWIDPVKGIAYVLMVQRTNFPNSDASVVRLRFQEAVAAAMK
jgi:CubicO group peptidase (beta-lactamase class C family)